MSVESYIYLRVSSVLPQITSCMPLSLGPGCKGWVEQALGLDIAWQNKLNKLIIYNLFTLSSIKVSLKLIVLV